MERLAELPESLKLHLLALVAKQQQQDEEPAQMALLQQQQQQQQQQQESPTSPAPAAGISASSESTSYLQDLPELPHLSASGLAVVDGFLTPEQLQAAATEAASLLTQLRPAGMGGSDSRWLNHSARGDVMHWLHKGEQGAAGRAALEGVMERVAALKTQLATQGFNVGGRITHQLACYPGGGARYVRHRDASDSAPGRTLTAICYLNPVWDVQAGGGQLALYNVPHLQHPGATATAVASAVNTGAAPTASSTAAAETPQSASASPATQLPDLGTVIAPLGGRLVVFDSRLEHEVLPAFQPRYALTTWFYKADAGTVAASAGAAEHTRAGTLGSTATGAAASTPDSDDRQLAASELREDGATGKVNQAGCSSNAASTSGRPFHAHDPPKGISHHEESIFVSIVSYRDPETRWTLWDLYRKAAFPERVHVGVVWQTDPVEDAALMSPVGVAAGRAPPWLSRVREVRLPYQQAQGPCLARHLAQALWRGERYVLQLDAHMRFVESWDTACIQQLHLAEAAEARRLAAATAAAAAQDKCEADISASPGAALCSCRPSSAGRQLHSAAPGEAEVHAVPKVVLSTYPPGYDGSGAAVALPDPGRVHATLLCAQGFGADGMLRLVARSLVERPPSPVASLYWAAGFSFSRSALLREVPVPDSLPHLFFGEEMYMLARMWTRGWRVYAPSVPLVFHQWQRSERPHTIQVDQQGQADRELGRRQSQLKVLALLGAADWPEHISLESASSHAEMGAGVATAPGSLPKLWQAGEVWGLGTHAPLQQFEQEIGVCFRTQSLQERALWGGLGPGAFCHHQLVH